MRTLGLDADQLRAFHALLFSHHTIDVRVSVLDLDHKYVGTLSDRLLDGQVTVDREAEVTRALSLSLLDPDRGIQLDSDSPNDGALFMDRMIQVTLRVVEPAGVKAYPVTVFTGPIVKLERTGAVVKVEAQGKEMFGLARAWRGKTYKKGTRATTAIKGIVGGMMGEPASRIVVADSARKLPRNFSVGDDKLPWPTAVAIARSLGQQLYYDGDGVCRMRIMPDKPVLTLREGVSVKSEPQAGFSISSAVNAVQVLGKKPKKPKKGSKAKGRNRPQARVVAARSHPLSPWRLGRSGGPRYLPLVIEEDSVTTVKQARELAAKELRKQLVQSIDVAYDAMTIPHLEAGDTVRVETSRFAANHRADKFVIPLTAAGDTSMGYVKRTTPNSAIRTKARNAGKK